MLNIIEKIAAKSACTGVGNSLYNFIGSNINTYYNHKVGDARN